MVNLFSRRNLGARNYTIHYCSLQEFFFMYIFFVTNCAAPVKAFCNCFSSLKFCASLRSELCWGEKTTRNFALKHRDNSVLRAWLCQACFSLFCAVIDNDAFVNVCLLMYTSHDAHAWEASFFFFFRLNKSFHSLHREPKRKQGQQLSIGLHSVSLVYSQWHLRIVVVSELYT